MQKMCLKKPPFVPVSLKKFSKIEKIFTGGNKK